MAWPYDQDIAFMTGVTQYRIDSLSDGRLHLMQGSAFAGLYFMGPLQNEF